MSHENFSFKKMNECKIVCKNIVFIHKRLKNNENNKGMSDYHQEEKREMQR